MGLARHSGAVLFLVVSRPARQQAHGVSNALESGSGRPGPGPVFEWNKIGAAAVCKKWRYLDRIGGDRTMIELSLLFILLLVLAAVALAVKLLLMLVLIPVKVGIVLLKMAIGLVIGLPLALVVLAACSVLIPVGAILLPVFLLVVPLLALLVLPVIIFFKLLF